MLKIQGVIAIEQRSEMSIGISMRDSAGLDADIARLERLRAAHQDDQFAVRRQLNDAERDINYAIRRIAEIGEDIARQGPTAGDASR